MNRRWPLSLCHLLAAFCVSLGAPVPVMASVYECIGPAGDRILTDEPQSFVNCTPLAIETVPQPPQGPAPSRQRPPSKEVPSPMAEPAAPAGQSQTPNASPTPPDSSSLSDPEYAPLPRIVAPQTQTCAKGINRLNPFGSAPCQPVPGSPPASVPYEDYYR